MNRRIFLAATGSAALAATSEDRPALLGGKPVRPTPLPSWPVSNDVEEKAVLDVVRSGRWGRGSGKAVSNFEAAYARLMGAGHCLATSSGTSALLTGLSALDVGAGDEVIVPPYTFVACVNVILLRNALPIFVDTDANTFQVDAGKLGAAITERTMAIMPVHLGGSTFDVDAVLAVAKAKNVPILEDSCQAHLAEWRGKRTGGFGKAGCFSFQASKNLNSGEGGALLTNDPAFLERCYTFHNNGRGRTQAGVDFSYAMAGTNVRLTEFQAAILTAQMTRIESQSQVREQNARYLTESLKAISGITPARMYAGTTRNAYHLYMMRYDASSFSGLPRAKFLKALAAEGIHASSGYTPLNREPFLRNVFESRAYQRIYGKKLMAEWLERNQCPENDRLCSEAVWLTQTQLLGPRTDMDQIVEAVQKVRRFGAELARS